MIHFLAIAVSLIFFGNKILILIGKKSGWLLGSIAGVLGVLYFYLIGLYVFTALEFGLIILMGYGFFAKDRKNPQVEKILNGTIILIMAALAYFASSGLMTIWEFAGSISMLLGTYFLTHQQKQLGWITYFLAHACSAYVGYHKSQEFFADFQVASAVVSSAALFYRL